MSLILRLALSCCLAHSGGGGLQFCVFVHWFHGYYPRWNELEKLVLSLLVFFKWSRRSWSWWAWRDKSVGTGTDGAPTGGGGFLCWASVRWLSVPLNKCSCVLGGDIGYSSWFCGFLFIAWNEHNELHIPIMIRVDEGRSCQLRALSVTGQNSRSDVNYRTSVDMDGTVCTNVPKSFTPPTTKQRAEYMLQ